jgi:hypothetical protein
MTLNFRLIKLKFFSDALADEAEMIYDVTDEFEVDEIKIEVDECQVPADEEGRKDKILSPQIRSKKLTPKQRQKDKEDKLDRSLFRCKNCEERFATLKQLQIHLDSKHLNIPPSFNCNDCEKSFMLVSTSINHLF